MLCTSIVSLMLTLDGRVILIDEVALNELDGQGRFAYSTTTDDDAVVCGAWQRGTVSILDWMTTPIGPR